MSFLVVPDGVPDFDKAVISFWFRVSKETLEAIAKQNANWPNPKPRMWGILPLVTFGEALDGYQIDSDYLPTTSYGDGDGIMWNGSEVTGGIFSDVILDPVEYTPGLELHAGAKTKEDPSHIGVYCQFDESAASGIKAQLHIKLQLSHVGTGVGLMSQERVHISDHWYCGAAIFDIPPPTTEAWDGSECIEWCYPSGGDAVYTYTYEDYTELLAKSAGGDSFMAGSDIEVEPDTWHHVLISFDISGSATSGGTVVNDDQSGCAAGPGPVETGKHTLSSSSKMWIAFDDKNYDKSHLRWNFVPPEGDPNRDNTFGLGDNGIAPDMNYFGYYGVSFGATARGWEGKQLTILDRQALGPPSYSTTGSKLKTNGRPLGIPCAPEHVDHDIHHVEMAEFLLFTDVTLDTSKEDNRRLFITKPDNDGKQHPTNPSPITVPVLKEAIGDPAIWEPGADWPVYVPPLLDYSSMPTTVLFPGDEKPKTAAIDFTKADMNWMIGRNLGTATHDGKNVPKRTGKIKGYADPVLEPVKE